MVRYIDADKLCHNVLWDKKDVWDRRDIIGLINSMPALNTNEGVSIEKPVISFHPADLAEKPFDTLDGID